ncbi:hypothetical protein [Reinekea sp. G2M2-21]|uniref:glycosyl hydrolase 2 galactose-binding domain-containing protein n=1 Tax=Reinekea sp. G2M2-21 TaxID=2788942 RepID=UPI0018AC4941|nr:hypothetical protein [Reinekea sp. G2M2-21]
MENCVLKWTLTGYDDDSSQPIVQRVIDKAKNVNSVFPEITNAADLRWVYETSIELKNSEENQLNFSALSPQTRVFIDGELLHTACNRFHQHKVRLPNTETRKYSIRVEFPSLNEKLSEKKPRPRWKTNLANNNLRFIRTSLLGHIVGWAAQTPEIGICGPVTIESSPKTDADQFAFRATEKNGIAILDCTNNSLHSVKKITIKTGNREYIHEWLGNQKTIQVALPDLELWWPHTHGKPALHQIDINIQFASSSLSIKQVCGFKSSELIDSNLAPRFSINGQSFFARGACWTHSNITDYQFDELKTEKILKNAVQLGFNMIRIGGTMTYENSRLYEMCDELGILVWQDFMFANFDYPDSEEFRELVKPELQFQINRLEKHACVAIWCGNSEVEQQANMVGISTDEHILPLFYDWIPAELSNANSKLPYVPSSPFGGDFAFDTNIGLSHYFGLGAYKRDESDLELSDVKFTSECLGHSHCPDISETKTIYGTPTPNTTSSAWKHGVPRDANVGWDFEDIRNHYVEGYFGIEPSNLRQVDTARYLEISRVTTGYLLAQAFNFWRSDRSKCNGALIWWLNDLYPGSGWGLISASGRMKPAGYILKSQLQPIHLSIIDNGLNGHNICWQNETNTDIETTIKVHCVKTYRDHIEHFPTEVSLLSNSRGCFSVNSIIGQFRDTTNAYSFTPEAWDAIAVSMEYQSKTISYVHFPSGLNLPMKTNLENLKIDIEHRIQNNELLIMLKSNALIAFAEITIRGMQLQENFQTLIPGVSHSFIASPENGILGDEYSLVVKGTNMIASKRLSLSLQ